MEKLKSLSKYRNFILIIMDMFCIALAYYLGTVLITDTVFNFSDYYFQRLITTVVVSIFVYQFVFHITGRYKNIIRYEDRK